MTWTRRLRSGTAVALAAALTVPVVGVLGAPALAAEAPPDSDFEVVTLAKGADKTGEPIAMAVLPDRHVLHTSRDGRVWLTTPEATTSLAGTIPVYSHDEDGLQGIAVDADFATNRWVYVYYAPLLSTPGGDAPADGAGPETFAPYEGHNQLSRIRLTAAGQLDLSSEQRILQVPADRGICCHAGGEIDFDAQGNLYLSTGDDTNPFAQDGYTPIDERATRNPAYDAQRSSANTNDLRGKLLRITVAEDGSYTVPEGNLFSEAADTAGKTRPEIYAMGFRNPFRFAVDKATGWVHLGDYGPDAGAAHPDRGPAGQVEFNLIKGPGNYGWPYCHGKNDAYDDYDFATSTSGPAFDCAAPKNDSPRNTGLVDLPPAQPAWIAYDQCSVPEFGCGSESPMGGPTYSYDPDNPSPTKFPAYYDGKNFAYEFGRGWIKALSVGATGALEGIEPVLDSVDFKQLINIEFGPDGALYVLDYGTGFFSGDAFSALYRVDHVQGTRSPVAQAGADRTSGPAPLTVQFSSDGSRDPDGTPVTYAWDFDADGTVDSTEADPAFTYTDAGRYTAALTVTDAAGQTGRTSINIVAGNTAPTVRITFPADGGIFEHGDLVPYRISVTDPEDGTVDCTRVRLDTSLGHDEHAHGDQSVSGCSGTVTVPAAWEDKTQHSFYVLTATYTDSGVTTSGLELTGTDQVVLEHRTQQAEFFDGQSGLQTVAHGGAAGGSRVGYVDPGDWLRFDDLDLSGIDRVSARITSTANSSLELRSGSPTGQLLARFAVPNTGGVDDYVTLPSVPITDPGRTADLFAVFPAAGMDLDEFTFEGPGVTGNASPRLDATVEPVSGPVPLTVHATATASDPEGTAVTLTWDWGVPGVPASSTPTATHTYQLRGSYTVTLTATDADGRRAVRTFPVSAAADCPAAPPAPSDEFDGAALDPCRWTSVLREDPAHYRVTDGQLQIDALDGDMYAGTTTAKNLVLQDAPDGAWEAVTKVALPQGEEYEQAGLIVHSDDQDFAKLVLIDIPGQGWRVELGQNVDGGAVFDEALDRSGALPAGLDDSGVWLRLRSNGLGLTGAWSADGQTWTPLGRTRPLGGMPDPEIGLAAYNGSGQTATFDFFRLTEGGEVGCQTPATPEAGYRMLFDGTQASLDTWRMAGPGSFPLQEDCSILTVGGLGLLYHPDALESYSLKLDWKMAGDDNGGVFVGFTDPGTDPFHAVRSGHEIQIDATDDADSTTGAVYDHSAADLAARDAAVRPAGEWNSYEIVVQGQRIRVLLNGVEINDYVDTDPHRLNPPSLVGLQNHGHGDDVFYRDVQIKELPTPTGPAPSLAVTSPPAGAVVDSGTVTVSGTTDAATVEVRTAAGTTEVTPTGGSFSAEAPLVMGSNRIGVVASSDTGVPTSASVTVVSRDFGTRVGGLTDPAGDDDGPGTYRYPTNAAFAPGGFDLLGLDVFTEGDTVRFVTRVDGELRNPWGGDQISHQRVNVYLGAGDGAPAPALVGTNMSTATPWSAVVVLDGRFDTAGVYRPDGTRLAKGTLFTVPQTREIGISLPASSLAGLDLVTASYGTAMFVNGESGEGLGFVRPVYDLAHWQDPPAGMGWITEYRMGGGAGVWTHDPDHDSDTRDPNAMDVIVGPGQTQAQVLDWQASSPTVLPMLPLTGVEEPADETPPVVTAALDPERPDGKQGWYVTPVTVTLSALDERAGAVTTEHQLDDGEWTSHSAPLVLSGDGTHTVRYRATDAAGNRSEAATLSVRIDATAPTTTTAGITGGAAYGDSSTVTPTWAATDATSGTGSLLATLDGRAITSGTALALHELTLGEHRLVVTATDLAGNTTTTALVFTVTTSIADLTALVTAFEGGSIPPRTATQLRTLLTNAQRVLDKGDVEGAVAQLRVFAGRVDRELSAAPAVQQLLRRDADAVIATLLG